MHRTDQSIPIERRRLLAAYLNDQYVEAATRGSDASRAESMFEQIMAQRTAKQQKIRALEEHRDREKHEHDARQTRAELRDADELWLITRR